MKIGPRMKKTMGAWEKFLGYGGENDLISILRGEGKLSEIDRMLGDLLPKAINVVDTNKLNTSGAVLPERTETEKTYRAMREEVIHKMNDCIWPMYNHRMLNDKDIMDWGADVYVNGLRSFYNSHEKEVFFLAFLSSYYDWDYGPILCGSFPCSRVLKVRTIKLPFYKVRSLNWMAYHTVPGVISADVEFYKDHEDTTCARLIEGSFQINDSQEIKPCWPDFLTMMEGYMHKWDRPTLCLPFTVDIEDIPEEFDAQVISDKYLGDI